MAREANSTSFKKGEATGRPKGVQNKSTRLVKEVFSDAFSALQQDPVAKLEVWGKKNPTEFYKLASKLIPIQVGSDPDNPLPSAVIISPVGEYRELSRNETEIDG